MIVSVNIIPTRSKYHTYQSTS